MGLFPFINGRTSWLVNRGPHPITTYDTWEPIPATDDDRKSKIWSKNQGLGPVSRMFFHFFGGKNLLRGPNEKRADFLLCTVVNHHFSPPPPPFGRIFFTFAKDLKQIQWKKGILEIRPNASALFFTTSQVEGGNFILIEEGWLVFFCQSIWVLHSGKA